MSATLYFYPDIPQRGIAFSDELKYILGKKLCDTDGTIGYDTVLDEKIIPYLEGLQDAGIKDAKELIEAIKKYGTGIIRWEH